MQRVLIAVLVVLLGACAAPRDQRWVVSVPFEAGLKEDAAISGARFMAEAPVQPDWTIYWAGTVLLPEADGSDAGTDNDFEGELYEGSIGLRRYWGGTSAIRLFTFGEAGFGNRPWDQLDHFGWVMNVMGGAGIRLDIDRAWSIEGAWAYRYTYAKVNNAAFPGLDAEDALTGGIAWIGIGYDF